MSSNKILLFILFILTPGFIFAQKSLENAQSEEQLLTDDSSIQDEDLSLELGADNIKLITKEDLKLRSSPGTNGLITGNIAKGIRVQQLDIIGNHYLICYMGDCGYVQKDQLSRVRINEEPGRKSKDSIPEFEIVHSEWK